MKTTGSFQHRLQEMGPWGRASVLVASLSLAGAIVAAVAGWVGGISGLLAALYALLLCALPALFSLALGEVFRGPDGALYSLLLGMLLRLGIPLVGFLTAYVWGGPLVEGGLVFCLLVLYPIMLTVETVLLTAQVQTEFDRSEAH